METRRQLREELIRVKAEAAVKEECYQVLTEDLIKALDETTSRLLENAAAAGTLQGEVEAIEVVLTIVLDEVERYLQVKPRTKGHAEAHERLVKLYKAIDAVFGRDETADDEAPEAE